MRYAKNTIKTNLDRVGLLKPAQKCMRQSLVWADHIIHGPLFKRQIANTIGDNSRVLDIGFGQIEAMLLPYLTSRIKSYVGVDMDLGNVAIAEAALDSGRLPSTCSFIGKPIEKCDFPEQSFDVIFSSGVFGLIPAYREVIECCAKWLSPNGHLVLSLNARFPSRKNRAVLARAYKCIHPFANTSEVESGVTNWLDWNRKGIRDGQFGHLPGKKLISDDEILTEVEQYFSLSYSFGVRPFIDVITKDLQITRLPVALLVKPIDFLANATNIMEPTFYTYVYAPKHQPRK